MAASSHRVAIAGGLPARTVQARRGLAIFFAVVVPLSAVLEAIIFSTGVMSSYLVLLLMWTPALAALIARVVLREGVTDVSFRLGGRRGWAGILYALCLPIVVGLSAYGIAWATGLAQFVEPQGGLSRLSSLSRQILGGNAASSTLVFAGTLLLTATFGTLVSALSAAGEELGWRGYMLTRLVDAGVPQPLLVSGVIWALWHVPLILAGVYVAGPSRAFSALIFVIGVSSVGYIIGRLRLETGSIWPAIALHAAWNSIIQGAFDPATAGARAKLWTGESGVLVSLVLVVIALALTRRSWTMRHQPPRREQVAIPEIVATRRG